MWMCSRCQSINEDTHDVCPRCRAAKVAQTSPVVQPSAIAPQFSQAFDPNAAPGAGSTATPPAEIGAPYSGYQPAQTYTEPPVSFGSAPGSSPAGYGAPQTGASTPPTQGGYTPPASGSATPSSGASEVAAVAALGIGALLLRLLNPVRLIFIAIGIACILGGNYLANRRTAFMSHAVRVMGSVTALKEEHSGDSTMYYPVVAFTTKDGVPETITSSSGSRPPEFHVGEPCTVYYNPLAPNDAVIDSASSKFVPWFLWAFGAIMILAALFGRQTAS